MIQDSIVTGGAPVLEEILRRGIVRTPAGGELKVHSHIAPEAGRLMQQIIGDLEAATTLEVGLAFGISALFICEAIANRPGARHIAIDPYQHDEEYSAAGLSNIRAAGFGHLLEFHEAFSHQAIPQLELAGVRLDFALVDGWHTFDYVLVDLFLVDRILRVGGVMFIDDTEWPGVRKACRYFVTNRRYRVLTCWGGGEPQRLPTIRKAIGAAARRLPALARVLKPELVEPEESLGFVPGCRCIALVKQAEDDGRDCFGHQPF